MKQPFASLTPDALATALAAHGAKRFVARQVLEAVYGRNARSFDEITNVSLELRRALSQRYELRTVKVVEHCKSPDGSFKLVLELTDGHLIECALLATGRRGTVCISSQVGCAMGCVFCASGEKGLVRNLTPAEMVEQVLLVRDRLGYPDGRRTLSGVTVMGVGEPLANLDNLFAALETINSPWGLGIGSRKIAISTCGLPEGIARLAGYPRQFHLAISLHAPTDILRKRLMPSAAGAATVTQVMRAARDYVERTHRKVSIEYVLVREVNDDVKHAELLADLLGGFPVMVNLIPLNPTDACGDLKPTTKTQTGRFLATLKTAGIDACVRRRKGGTVDAACGQLRARRMA